MQSNRLRLQAFDDLPVRADLLPGSSGYGGLEGLASATAEHRFLLPMVRPAESD